jgi:hypothetical protein
MPSFSLSLPIRVRVFRNHVYKKMPEGDFLDFKAPWAPQKYPPETKGEESRGFNLWLIFCLQKGNKSTKIAV